MLFVTGLYCCRPTVQSTEGLRRAFGYPGCTAEKNAYTVERLWVRFQGKTWSHPLKPLPKSKKTLSLNPEFLNPQPYMLNRALVDRHLVALVHARSHGGGHEMPPLGVGLLALFENPMSLGSITACASLFRRQIRQQRVETPKPYTLNLKPYTQSPIP